MGSVATRHLVDLIPMAQVADVQRSVDFYKLLGMEVGGSLRSPSGELQWVHLACKQAELMFTRSEQPLVANQPTVLFYLYSSDLVGLREHLLANNVKVSEISYPEYMRKGEVCLSDPDGYTLLVGQAG